MSYHALDHILPFHAPQVADVRGQGHWNVSFLLPKEILNPYLFDLGF